MRMLRIALLSCVLASALGGAIAQDYPSKTVKFVLPSAPGSSPDRVVRLLADRLGAVWGMPAIVENRPGATGTVGSEYVARSAPDGHTALFAFTSVIQAPALLPKVPYDIERDFAPVSLVAYAPFVVAVRADSPFVTLADYLAAARNPATPVSYGTFGNGSTYHIIAETLRRAARVNFIHVPYKGEAARRACWRLRRRRARRRCPRRRPSASLATRRSAPRSAGSACCFPRAHRGLSWTSSRPT